jgi:hypothetical protein
MRKDVKYFLLFITPIIIIAYFVDVFISKNLKNSNRFAEKEYPTWNAIYEGNVNSDLLIFGSSRAWVHIDPTMITDSLGISSYNLGIDGHNFWLQNLRYRELLKHNKKPKFIIFSLDYLTLMKNKELYNSEQFLPFMLWNKDMKDATISYKGFSAIDYEIPLIRYYGNHDAIEKSLRYFTGHLSNPITRIRGYRGREENWNSDFDNAKASMKSFKIKLDNPSIVLFENFLKECKANNIKLIFVYTPEYIEGQKFVSNREYIMGLYKKYSKQYQIPFYDFSNDSISYHKKYFYNVSHLNKVGSQLFTKKLIDTLKYSDVLRTKSIK